MSNYRPITDLWILARCKYKGGAKRWGGYLGGFPERARALLGATINDPVLHVCGGLARLYPYAGGFGPNDQTLDLDAGCQPDFLQDARQPLPSGFAAILADPPYSDVDADHYAPGREALPKANALVANMLAALQPGQRCGIIHYIVPSPPKGTRFVACVGVVSGFNNRIRSYSVFERGAEVGQPVASPVADLLAEVA
jgi:hypothetical protein